MEYFLPVIGFYDDLHPFFQNLSAAAVFAALLWMFRILSSKVSKTSSDLFVAYQRIEMFRHIIHKELINSENIIFFSKGYFMITLEAFRWALRGILILVFFLGVDAITNRNWWMLLGYWFLFNCILEAYQTIKDKSSEKEISYIKQEIKDEVHAIVYRKNKESNHEPNHEIKRTEDTVAVLE